MEGAAILIVLFIGIGFTLGLYLLIKGETANPRVVDRETAIRDAKERGGLATARIRHGADDGSGEDERDGGSDDGADDRLGWIDDDPKER